MARPTKTTSGSNSTRAFVVLEILYSRRRSDPNRPALSQRELVELIGRPREHLEFTIWYLSQRKMVSRDDQSSLVITADGVDFVEQIHR